MTSSSPMSMSSRLRTAAIIAVAIAATSITEARMWPAAGLAVKAGCRSRDWLGSLRTGADDRNNERFLLAEEVATSLPSRGGGILDGRIGRKGGAKAVSNDRGSALKGGSSLSSRGGAASSTNSTRKRKRDALTKGIGSLTGSNRGGAKKVKKMVKKRSKTGAAPPSSSPAAAPETKGTKGDTMPSIFKPSEDRFDRYAAALAVTEGLRRVRDSEVERIAEAGKPKKESGDEKRQRKREAEEAKRRAEDAFLLQSTKAVKALGMTVPQFNQIGREVLADAALKERVSEQAYLYRMATAINLDRVPLLEDPSSKGHPLQKHHRRYRVQMFARSITEIEDLRADQIDALRKSLRVERFPPGFDLSDPNVRPLLHPQVRAVCDAFPQQAEEIVKRYGLESEEFNRMLEETKGNPIFRWRVKKYVEKAEEEKAKKNAGGGGKGNN